MKSIKIGKILFSSVLILSLLSFTGIAKLEAIDAVLHSPDVLDVASPTANSKVKGTISIVWKMYDNDQNVIPYTANLYDAQTCNVTNYGQINSNPNGVSSLSQNNALSWNTKSTLSNPNLSDGNYCLKICAALKNGAAPYSACNSRNITIINNNRLPVITSMPSKLTIFENESWSYQIVANDPDGNALTYRFVAKPAWLDINGQTGLITSNGVDKNPGDNNTVKYGVVIAVDDNFSGSVTQQFEITVKKVSVTPSPNPSPNPTPTPPPPAPTNNPTVISIDSPTKDDVLESPILIEWSIQDTDGIEEVVLEYSQDGANWTEITRITDPNVTEYEWDVAEIEDGNYFIRVTVRDTLDTDTSKISGEFSIEHEVEEPLESVPLIINTSPLSDSETETMNPTISGEFVPSEEGEIDPTTFQIVLDDVNITSICVVDTIGFSCRLSQDLATGMHKVTVSITDTNQKTAVNEWNFSVLGEENPASYPEETVNILGTEVPKGSLILGAVICIIVFLLLLIPWILYILWTRRSKNTDESLPTADAQANQIDNNYGYYLPPYNPIPNEPTYTPQEFGSTFEAAQPTVETSPEPELEHAEPIMDIQTEKAAPVLPEQSEDLAKEEVPAAPISDAPVDQFKLPETVADITQAQPEVKPEPSQKPGEEEFVEPEATDQ